MKVELDLYNYLIMEQKTDLHATGVDTSGFAKNTDWYNLKSDVDKLDSDRLKNVRNDLRNFKVK